MTTADIRTCDVVVIGAGPVGENVAERTGAAGLSTVIVESELVGGECSYWVCEPSKAMLLPTLLHAEASRVPDLNPAVAGPLTVTAVQGDWLHAVGDVNQRALFTHQGKYQARIAGAVVAARAHRTLPDTGRRGAHVGTADTAAVPQVVFTDPEVAAVGLTTVEAERTGRRVVGVRLQNVQPVVLVHPVVSRVVHVPAVVEAVELGGPHVLVARGVGVPPYGDGVGLEDGAQ